jgi:hypothetical protein
VLIKSGAQERDNEQVSIDDGSDDAAPLAVAADPIDPGCGLAGDVRVGGMMDWQNATFDDLDADTDWTTMFGEGRGLVTCGAGNFQLDFATYNHSTNVDGIVSKDLSADANHYGGAAFWRDPSMGLIGITGSRISNEVIGKDIDYSRIGLVGDYYANDMLTFGGKAHYVFSDDIFDIAHHNGFELQANAKFYATPNFSLNFEGTYLNSDIKIGSPVGVKVGVNGWAFGSEAEYMVMDQGLSIFAGGRYATRTANTSNLIGDDINFKDMQAYVGVKYAFGGNTESLLTRDRTGPIDNTSLFYEKLPNLPMSALSGLANSNIVN